MNIPRRAFLVGAGTAFAGLWWLDSGAEEPDPGSGKGTVPPPKPKVLADALERMSAEHKPGIVLRIPKQRDQRHNPGHLLVPILNQDTPQTRELLSEVVLVCLEGPVVERHLPAAPPEHDLVLLNEEGQTEAGLAFNPDENRQGLPAALATLAHGPDGARLKSRAERIRRKTDAAVLAVLDRLGGKGTDVESDKTALLQSAPRIIPLLVQARQESTGPARQQALGDVIDFYYRSFEPSAAGPKLPYGIEAGPHRGGCGQDSCREQPPRENNLPPPCGMALVTPQSRSFVRYLTQ